MKFHSLVALLFFALFLTACGDTSSTDTQPPATPEDTVATPKTPDPVQESYEGVDVSHYQNRINWRQVAASGRNSRFAKPPAASPLPILSFKTIGSKSKGWV